MGKEVNKKHKQYPCFHFQIIISLAEDDVIEIVNSMNTHNYVKYSNVETHDPVRTFNNGINAI